MSWWSSLRRRWRRPAELPDALWQRTLSALPFLHALSAGERLQLRGLCAQFLAEKEFTGANGLQVTDAMALSNERLFVASAGQLLEQPPRGVGQGNRITLNNRQRVGTAGRISDSRPGRNLAGSITWHIRDQQVHDPSRVTGHSEPSALDRRQVSAHAVDL